MARDTVVQIVVGSSEQIRSGRGETAVTQTDAAFRLKISPSRLSQLSDAGRLRPVAQLGRMLLYLESDVEALRADRDAALEARTGTGS